MGNRMPKDILDVVGDGIPLESAMGDFFMGMGGAGQPCKGDGTDWATVDSGTNSAADSGICCDGDGDTGGGGENSATYPSNMGEAEGGFRKNQRPRKFKEDDERGALR